MTSSSSKSGGKTVDCYGCGKTIRVFKDQWWQYSWEENPSRDDVERAIENTNFRDWVTENYVFCSQCHERIQSVVEV